MKSVSSWRNRYLVCSVIALSFCCTSAWSATSSNHTYSAFQNIPRESPKPKLLRVSYEGQIMNSGEQDPGTGSGSPYSDAKFVPEPRTSETFTDCCCEDPMCTCELGYGTINSSCFQVAGDQIFQFDSEQKISVMVWVEKLLLPPLTDSCYFEVGDVSFSEADFYNDTKIELRNITTVYITTSDVIVTHIGDSNCAISMRYAAVTPTLNTSNLSNLTGTISFPTQHQLMDQWGYPPQQRLAYFFNYPNDSYTIDLTISKQDLGYRSSALHWVPTNMDAPCNDFLLIGLGTEILGNGSGPSLTLYGRASATRTMRLRAASAYIVFYAEYHEQYATGFTIHYTVVNEAYMGPMTTAPPIPTPYMPPRPYTWVAVDGVLTSYSSIAELNSSFCSAMAGMATMYINETGLDVDSPPTVNPADVLVSEVATCSPTTCAESCAAFYFTVNKTNGNSWAFTQHDLDAMLSDSASQDSWREMCEDCEVCEEVVDVSWGALGASLSVLLALAVLLTLVVCGITRARKRKESKDAYSEFAAIERRDFKRHSSGQVSVVGVLKNLDRQSLSFRRKSSTEGYNFSAEHYDVAGFSMFEPDDDFDDFGLDEGGSYVNKAYLATIHDHASVKDHKRVQRAAPPDGDGPAFGDHGDTSDGPPSLKTDMSGVPSTSAISMGVHVDGYGEETEL